MAARYRQTASASSKTPSSSAPEVVKSEKSASNDSAPALSVIDVLRILAGMLVLSCGMSYLSTSGESMTWGYNPWWTRAREWKALWQGGVFLTDDQLLAYDGTDPKKPIYLALNGTIYDVSASPQTYGPGGSYHFFAGRDAARAFLTGCFQEDLTPDLRGVEQMYMPVDAPLDDTAGEKHTEAQSYDPVAGKETQVADPNDPAEQHRKARSHDKRRTPLSKSQIKNRHAQELRKARKQVKEGLEHWHQMFRGDKGKPYFKAGEVVREKGWLQKLEKRTLCEHAEKSRPVRKDVEE
ncbi:uncharacterized protein BDR25DRAFT_336568 [Lindgomyces ingoldianus]|uniref:Uncharacterized protein n=1 Tax=Lindgomyces ingoldianus TaxID=673940 RepID=A0ACB6QHF3_9PLEO|nr:uncharacterized protein BDR25DRAFT_336568 [Lindgomyces ingoldianus]KAF2466423.1 hypothetical protein BDR25DRAFT_336568 [Lindgomyces ingoldianus]